MIDLLFQRVLLGYRNHSVLHAIKNVIKTGKRDAQVVKPTSWDNHSLTRSTRAESLERWLRLERCGDFASGGK